MGIGRLEKKIAFAKIFIPKTLGFTQVMGFVDTGDTSGRKPIEKEDQEHDFQGGAPPRSAEPFPENTGIFMWQFSNGLAGWVQF